MAAEQWNYSLNAADDDPEEKQRVFLAEEAYDEELNECYSSIPAGTIGFGWYDPRISELQQGTVDVSHSRRFRSQP